MTDKPKGGRPPAPPELQRVNVPLRLPRWLVEWIDAQGGTRAEVIEAALTKAHQPVQRHASRLARARAKKTKE